MRIAEWVYNNPSLTSPKQSGSASVTRVTGTGYETNIFDTLNIGDGVSSSDTLIGSDTGEDGLSANERRVLDRVAEDLARLGRVKRVGLGVQEKIEFVKVWGKRKR